MYHLYSVNVIKVNMAQILKTIDNWFVKKNRQSGISLWKTSVWYNAVWAILEYWYFLFLKLSVVSQKYFHKKQLYKKRYLLSSLSILWDYFQNLEEGMTQTDLNFQTLLAEITTWTFYYCWKLYTYSIKQNS